MKLDLVNFIFMFIGIMAFTIASYVLIRKKPIIINSILLPLPMVLILIPQMIQSLQMFFIRHSAMDLLLPVLFLLVIAWGIFIMRGFSVLGVDGDDFKKALGECLKGRGLKFDYEQSIASLRIKDPECELSIAITAWAGSVKLRSTRKVSHPILATLVRDLKNKPMKTNLITPVFHIIIGIVSLVVLAVR
jgi:hypothetical protein